MNLTPEEEHELAVAKLMQLEREWRDLGFLRRILSGYEYKSKIRQIVDELKRTDEKLRNKSNA